MALPELIALLCALLFRPLVAAQTTIDVPFFGGITSQLLSGNGAIYSGYTYITLCSSTSHCGSSDVVIMLSTYEGWTSTFTNYEVYAYGNSDVWHPFTSSYSNYDCTLESSTASCWIGSDGEQLTSWSDVTPIPVTLTTLQVLREPEIITYSDFETVTITANGGAGTRNAVLDLPIIDTDTWEQDMVQATVVDFKSSTMTLRFAKSDEDTFPDQTLTIGPHTWHMHKTYGYYSATRTIDCSFEAVQYESVGSMSRGISNGGSGAWDTGTTTTVITDVTQVAVTLVGGVEKLSSTSTTAAASPSGSARSMSEASAGASVTPGAAPTDSSNPFATSAPTPTSDTSAGVLTANGSLLAIAAAMLVACLL